MSRSGSPCELSSKPESEENVVPQAGESSISPQQLSEAQLRRLYDEEEAERLMHLISAVGTRRPWPWQRLRLPRHPDRESSNHCSSNPVPPPLPPRPSNPGSTHIRIYCKHRSTPPPFTTRRFRLAMFLWVLWYHDGLLAAFLCRIVWCLFGAVSCHIHLSSLAEFQEKRQNATRARRLSVVINAGDSEEIQSLKRDLLHLLDVVADLQNASTSNILMWRRPAVTRRYCILLSIAALSVIVLPAQYVTKLMCMLLGIVYWHLVPVNPPLFADAPTDVEYAIELIGQRVASGTELTSCSKTRDRVANPSSSGLDLTVTESIDSEQTEEREGLSWKKWGARIAQGKSLLEENKSISSLSRSLFDKLPRQTQPDRHSSQLEQVHTFPAQHTSALGLITLTSTTIYFTSLTAMQAKLVVPYSQLRSVKKTGLMKGLAIAWVPTDQDTEGVVREERFHWVGDRDELFARLLGRDGGRWMRL
ncbi:hypothetical protein BKA82DRAFT_4091844 [Pisolithus tinctorius]|nr:hypothetical protein BKA82DRAFT_4091844 [Pisolithus tinctorius]